MSTSATQLVTEVPVVHLKSVLELLRWLASQDVSQGGWYQTCRLLWVKIGRVVISF